MSGAEEKHPAACTCSACVSAAVRRTSIAIAEYENRVVEREHARRYGKREEPRS